MKLSDLPIFSLFRSRGRVSRQERMAAFTLKYDNFKLLLESNTELLKIISDIEQKLRGQSPFGLPYIEAQTMRAFFHCSRMIQCIEKMAGRPYAGLKEALERVQQAIKGQTGAVARSTCRDFVLGHAAIRREMADAVGEKNANIAEVHNRAGLLIPRGFAITTAAFDHFMSSNRLLDVLQRLKAQADIIETETILQVSEQIQMVMAESDVPEDLGGAILEAYDRLAAETPPERRPLKISMRSSAIGEDSTLSFAGQYLTVLNVPRGQILAEYKNILASLFTPRAIAYRLHMGIPFSEASMAVACMEMIPAHASGVMYTRNPVNPLDNRVLINAVWGLGPYAVDGIVPPDSYFLDKSTPPALLKSRIQEKHARLVGRADGYVVEEPVEPDLRNHPCLAPEQAQELAAAGLHLESLFDGPQDVEWALDECGRFVILQARPLRLEGRDSEPKGLAAEIPEGAQLALDDADVACPGIGCGPVVVVRSEEDLTLFPDGGVLVAVHASPQYVMAMNKAQAILIDFGSIVSHMASLAREYMVPTLMNLRRATAAFVPGETVTIDAYNGRVYRGRVPEVLNSGLRHGGFVVKGPAYQALRRRADLIVPLNLTDPRSAQFTEHNCRTIHDIMRYIHETSYTIVFQLGDLVTDRSSVSVAPEGRHTARPLRDRPLRRIESGRDPGIRRNPRGRHLGPVPGLAAGHAARRLRHPADPPGEPERFLFGHGRADRLPGRHRQRALRRPQLRHRLGQVPQLQLTGGLPLQRPGLLLREDCGQELHQLPVQRRGRRRHPAQPPGPHDREGFRRARVPGGGDRRPGAGANGQAGASLH